MIIYRTTRAKIRMSADEAFDNLTDEIMRQITAETDKHKCSCCEEETEEYLRLYLCGRHMNKYKDILSIEKK